MAYTNIDDPSAYFQTKVYTGTNANQSITNDGNSDLQPDLIFASYRTTPPYTNHRAIIDSSRGRAKILESDTTAAEATTTNAAYDLVSFDTDGFTVGAVNSTSALNASGISHVAWQWKVNGGTTTSLSSNINSVCQVNQDAGISIVKYTCTGGGNGQAVQHGLGLVPQVIITKNRTDNSYSDWITYHHSIGYTNFLKLNTTAASAGSSPYNGAEPTSSTYNVSIDLVESTKDYVSYVFAPIQGYSHFGSYLGNGNGDGPMIYTGFKPAFVMIKPTSYVEEWVIIDAKRDPYNQAMLQLKANSNGAEYNGASVTNGIDILSNGFKVRTSRTELNTSKGSLIYMAFAENPFVTSTGVPATAR